MNISFITYSGEPHISSDDLPLAQEFARRRILSIAHPWDLAADERRETDAYLMRSAWNYDSDPDAFLLWVDRIVDGGKQLINSRSVIRWNISKDYLFQAEIAGFEIPKTRKFIPGTSSPGSIAKNFASDDLVVVKPCISLSAHSTFLLKKAELQEKIAQLPNTHKAYLLQEYLPEITTGELSFVFFDGHYSHCIIKVPKQGDFRVQGDHGATRNLYTPSSEQIEMAATFLQLVPEVPTYARIDVVMRSARMVLMEIEVIDPMLFLGWEPAAAARFADAILRKL